MSHLVDTILARLGADEAKGRRPVLLPILARQKGITEEGWQKTTWEKSRLPEYVSRLELFENTGVLLGEPSGGLCTIDFDNDEYVEPFLDLNPRLRKTLRTRGSKGCQLWLWMLHDPKLSQIGINSFPNKRYNLKHITRKIPSKTEGNEEQDYIVAEWRGGGGCQSVIQGIHPNGHYYEVLVDNPPCEILFRSIRWPDYVERPWEVTWMSALEAIYGVPAIKTKSDEKVTWELTEHFWAARYSLLHDIIMDKEENRFYSYDSKSGLWSHTTNEQVASSVSKHLLTFGRQHKENEFETNRIRGTKKISGIISFIAGENAKNNPWQKRPGVIHVQNGMIDLNEDRIELKPFDPSYYSRNLVPWLYDPKAECHRFCTELLGPALSDDDCELVQRIAGSLLMGVNLTQRIFIFTGTAGGGKSTLLEVLQMLIGQYNVANLRTGLLNERFEMQGFIGKTCLSAADVPGDFLTQKSTSVLKSLTGGDFLEAELKQTGLRVPLMGTFNITVTSNTRLTLNIKDDADAWRRRIVIISYQRKKPENPVDNFAQKLMRGDARLGWKPEAPGILNWAISGAKKLLSDSISGKGFRLNNDQKARIESLLNESESVRHFIEKRVEVYDEADVTNNEMIESYRDYCSDNGWNAVADHVFNNQARDYMLQFHRCAPCNCVKRTENGKTSAKRGYKNVRILSS